MAENSGISWTNHTFNPWIGCTKVSPACKRCYAETLMDTRYGRAQWGPMGTRVLTSPSNWKKPLAWNREAERLGIRYRVFCASLADVFEDWQGAIMNHKGKQLFVNADDGWTENASGRTLTMDDVRKELFSLIDDTPSLDWLLLTKRPENIERFWPYAGVMKVGGLLAPASLGLGHCRPNVWLGTTVENQEYADKRVPHLLKCVDMVPVLFLSCEPLLGPVHLETYLTREYEPTDDHAAFSGIDWVITGGESGHESRPCHPDWVRSIRDQCQDAGVAFHHKQWGEWLALSQAEQDPESSFADVNWTHNLGDDDDLARVGVKRAGRYLDGVIHDGVPLTSVSN